MELKWFRSIIKTQFINIFKFNYFYQYHIDFKFYYIYSETIIYYILSRVSFPIFAFSEKFGIRK